MKTAYEGRTTANIQTHPEERDSYLNAELMYELFIDNLQRVGTTALSKLFAVLES